MADLILRPSSDDDVGFELDGPVAVFTGSASALLESWVILPAWIPPLPKRLATSHDFDGWWLPEDKGDWERRTAPVHSWELRRVGGGLLRFLLWARYHRLFMGGPADPTASADTAKWHRRMVRARSDDAFCRFLIAAEDPRRHHQAPKRQRP